MSDLGKPYNWLEILSETGALAVIEQDLALWKHKALLTNPIIGATSFRHASELLSAVAARKKVSWIDFCAEMDKKNWKVASDLRARLGIGGKPVFSLDGRSSSPGFSVYVPSSFLSSVEAYFTRGAFVTKPNTEFATVQLILEQTKDTPIVKALKCSTSVIEMLEARPPLYALVGIALIRAGLCSPHTQVEHAGQALIQFKVGEAELCEDAIEAIIDAYDLKTLANFLSNGNAEKNWRNLFQHCNAEVIKEMLVKEGKSRSELNLWSTDFLIEYVATWAAKSNNPREYKLRVLRYLRQREVPAAHSCEVNGLKENMLPWLDSSELDSWLNPKKAAPAADYMVVDEINEETPLESLFKKAKVNAPEFIKQFQETGFVYEDLPFVLEGFNDPDLANIRSLLSMPQKLALKRALQ